MGSLLLLIACKYDDPALQNLYDEVMVIHDEVMPEISTMHKLQKKIKSKVKDMADDAPERAVAERLLTNLKMADEAMFDWMGQFKKPKKDAPKAEATAYLNQQKEAISEVSKKMKSSMKEAQDFLAK